MSRSNNFSASQKHKLLSVLIIVFLLIIVKGEAQIKIHGIITGNNGQPLQNANVLLLKAKDSSLAKEMVTHTLYF